MICTNLNKLSKKENAKYYFLNIHFKVLSSRDLDMMPSIKHLLKMLAAFDAVFLVFTLTLFCISAWSEHYNDFIRPWLTPYMLPGKFTLVRSVKIIHYFIINQSVDHTFSKDKIIISF